MVSVCHHHYKLIGITYYVVVVWWLTRRDALRIYFYESITITLCITLFHSRYSSNTIRLAIFILVDARIREGSRTAR